MSNSPEHVGAMRGNNDKYFNKGPGLDTDKGSAQYVGGLQLKDGYSNVAHQDAPNPVAFTQSKTARKGGGFDYGEKQYIYKKVEQKAAPAQQAPAPTPAPEPEAEKPKDDLVIKRSPEIEQAKARVNAYQSKDTSSEMYGQDRKSYINRTGYDADKYSFTPHGAS